MPDPLDAIIPPPLPWLGNVPRAEARAILLSIIAGVVLLAVKFAAYFLTSSTAVLSDAMESIVNVLASFFALYALRLAHAPADEDHPYGHGKVEFLSAGFEGGMVFLAALYIAVHVIYEFLNPHPLERVDSALLLMLLATLVNGAVGLFLIRAGRRANSLTLEADGHHLLADAITSIAVIISLLLVKFTGSSLPDPITAVLVSAYLVILAMRLLRRSTAGLMDEQDAADNSLIRGILDQHLLPDGIPPQICSYHKLRHRHSGRYHWIDMHLVVPPSHTITSAHELASRIEYEIEQALGSGNATAHVEPCADAAHQHG
jgi:cation diffusion facilitator family transporter